MAGQTFLFIIIYIFRCTCVSMLWSEIIHYSISVCSGQVKQNVWFVLNLKSDIKTTQYNLTLLTIAGSWLALCIKTKLSKRDSWVTYKFHTFCNTGQVFIAVLLHCRRGMMDVFNTAKINRELFRSAHACNYNLSFLPAKRFLYRPPHCKRYAGTLMHMLYKSIVLVSTLLLYIVCDEPETWGFVYASVCLTFRVRAAAL